MLRRRPDDSFELFLIGVSLQAAAPPPLADARREALRQRIMQNLGAQDRKQPVFGLMPGERWVLIPAGIGVVAAILAAARLMDDGEASLIPATDYAAHGPAQGEPSPSLVAMADGWRSFQGDIAVGLKEGSSISRGIDPGSRVLQFFSGEAAVAVGGSPVEVVGSGFSAELRGGSVAIFESRASDTLIRAMVGSLSLTLGDGSHLTLLEGAEYAVPFAQAKTDLPAEESESPRAPGITTLVAPVAPTVALPSPSTPTVQGSPALSPEPGANAAQPPPAAVNSQGHGSQPPVVEPFDTEGPILPASQETGPGSEQGTSIATDAPPSGGNGAANSNAGGNGNGNGAANSNAGGNGNGAANSNAGGNGNGNGAANSNAGGNGNGNSAANSNAGGNGNGNGAANSNAGGNGNGNGAPKKS